ncbi:hypothetical protein MIMGU_mgv11b018595mg, partial [Erythranthe guttata]
SNTSASATTHACLAEFNFHSPMMLPAHGWECFFTAERDIVYTGDTLKTSSLAMSRMPMKNNACVCVCFLARLCVYVLYVFLNRNKRGSQRDRHRERANARTTGKGKGKDDGFTPEQRRERLQFEIPTSTVEIKDNSSGMPVQKDK